jgi:hypothetical protein
MVVRARASRGGVLSAAGGTGTENDAADFLSQVVPWPQPGAPSFINIHWTFPAHPGMGGAPFTDLSDALSFIDWAKNQPADIKDLYFCLSLQARTGPMRKGKPTALRRAANAVAVKAIWLDIDCNKEPPRGYRSKEDGLKSLKEFCDATHTPYPTAIIDSGNGLHVYWISDKPLSAKEWLPYAEGLEALATQHGLFHDPITTDAARVLRVPGTSNNKQVPSKPVKILLLAADLSFASALSHLLKPNPEEHRPDHDFPPLPFEPIQEGCPFFADAHETHGKEHAQPLWHLSVLATTFFEDGERLAHELGNAHPDYTSDTTQAMWDRKVREREERSLGWPGCKAFEDAGCTFCKTCQHHGKIKSPLNLAVPVIGERDLDRTIEEVKEGKRDPVVEVRRLHKRRAGNEAMFTVLNASYAVVRYGGQIVIANVLGKDIILMKVEDFHKMYANVRVKAGDDYVGVSKLWFQWSGRRQYLGRGTVFEPGGPLDVPDDMLNLWRGFGIEPKQGDWSLLRNHLFEVVCSGNQMHFDYLIRWMALAVQRPNEPIGVAVALRGAQGAGKGIVARTLGKIFGRHFAHIANGEHLTGRFNAGLGTSCLVFLDEALWAGDKKSEGVLKALITEPRLQLEAKFRDPVMVENRLRMVVASNNDWLVPAGIGDRRWFILDVADTFAGTTHADYWNALYAEIRNGGAAAFFYDLLNVDLADFNVRAVPHTTAKAQQQAHSAWLYNVLQEGAFGGECWLNGLTVTKDDAYDDYVDFSKRQRDWRPDGKSVWSKKILERLGSCVQGAKQKEAGERVRVFKFAPLADCRRKFEAHVPNIEWEEPNNEPELVPSANPVTPDEVSPPEVSPPDGADADSPPQGADKMGKSTWRGTL